MGDFVKIYVPKPLNHQHHEERDLEDHTAGHRQHPHGCPDRPRNDLVHGARPHHILNRNLLTTPRPQSPHKRLRIFVS